jgi:hypothetical protein
MPKCPKCGNEIEKCSCEERKIQGFKKQGTCEVLGVIKKETEDAGKIESNGL